MPLFVHVSETYAGIFMKAVSCSILTFFILTVAAIPATAEYENPSILQAKSILNPEFLKNRNYSVQDTVRNDSLFNR
jgi:hypothetical protein